MQYCTFWIVFSFAFLTACCLKTDCGPPLSQARWEQAEKDLNYLHSTANLPQRPLTLEDILCIAAQGNLDVRVKELEWAIQREIVTRETLRMLPTLTFTGELSHRSNVLASSQKSLATGIVTPPSTSTEQQVKRWDITLALNILDFGLAYRRSIQEKNRALLVYFQYARLQQNLVLEVFKAYWKAVAAKKSAEESSALIAQAYSLQNKFEKQIRDRMVSEIPGLRIEDQLLALQLRLSNYYQAYQSAKAELAALMGIPPILCFDIEIPKIKPIPEIGCIAELEQEALLNRPELYGADMEVKISTDEIRIAMLQMIPGIELFTAYHEDKDKFLVHHNWFVTGMRAVWNLLSIPQRAAEARTARVRNTMNRVSRLAISVGVMTQVHLAYWKYKDVLSQFHFRKEIYTVRQRLLRAVKLSFEAGDLTITDVINAQGDALQAEIDLMQTYGDLRVSIEQINNAMGEPLFYQVPEEREDLECVTY